MNEQRRVAPGWYDYEDGRRYWDGDRWTDQYAPKYDTPPPQPRGSGFLRGVAATWIGFVLGWGTISGGAGRPAHLLLAGQVRGRGGRAAAHLCDRAARPRPCLAVF
jgi:hypothetical protein